MCKGEGMAANGEGKRLVKMIWRRILADGKRKAGAAAVRIWF